MRIRGKTKLILVLSFLALTTSVGISSFLVNNVSSSSSLIKDNTVKAVCYNSSTSTKYTTIDAAMDEATSGQSVYVYSGLEVTCTNSFTIKSGVSLYLPFEDQTINVSINSVSTSANRDTNASNVNTYRKLLVNMRNNADITIEQNGNLYIGGEFYTRGNSGKYAELNLGEGSSITCSGSIYCYGYIKEDSSTAITSDDDTSSNLFNNSIDENRYIRFTSTGSLTTPLGIHDGNSGGRLKALLDAGVCPITAFNISAIQTYYTFENGSTFKAIARLSAVSTNVEESCNIIVPNSSSENGIFRTQEGAEVSIEYVPYNPLYTKVGSGSGSLSGGYDYTKLIFNGDVTIGKIYMNISSVGTIDTSTNFLPISYNFNVYIGQDGNVTQPYPIKFLPGSKVMIDSGGIFNVNNKVIFYKSDSMSGVSSDDAVNYPSGLNGAELINNGTIKLASTASIGGYIKHSSKNTDSLRASVNLESTPSSNLSVTAQEGTTLKEIIVNSTANFYDESTSLISEEQFPGEQILYSNYNDDGYYWDGSYSNTASITIKVEDLYTYNIYTYTLYQATDANGTNSTAISSTYTGPDADASGRTFMVDKGTYIKLDVSREASTTLNDGAINFSNSTWYEVSQDMTFVITPNEGVSVQISTSGNSGAGHVEYNIYESENLTSTSSSGWVFVKGTETGAVTAYVIKNYNFYFTTYSAYGYYFTDRSYYIDGEFIGYHYAKELNGIPSASQLGNNIVYKANGNYSFEFKWNFPCIVEGTLILMSDKSYKKVEDLQAGDEILCYDHFSGKLVKEKLFFNYHSDEENQVTAPILTLEFENNIKIGIHFDHGFFDKTLNKYVYINKDNFNLFINHYFVVYKNNAFEKIKLLKGNVKLDIVKVYSPVSMHHLNVITNDLLSITGEIEGWFNFFDYNQNMQYINVDEDIKKYGLYDYNEFKDYISETIYNIIPIKYLKISVGKGYTTKEDILNVMRKYLSDK